MLARRNIVTDNTPYDRKGKTNVFLNVNNGIMSIMSIYLTTLNEDVSDIKLSRNMEEISIRLRKQRFALHTNAMVDWKDRKLIMGYGHQIALPKVSKFPLLYIGQLNKIILGGFKCEIFVGNSNVYLRPTAKTGSSSEQGGSH